MDFSSAPTKRKPITVALGIRDGAVLRLDRIETHATLTSFGGWLAGEGDWIGAFDFPFGLPRELVVALCWPLEWLPLMRHYAALPRATVRATFAAFCAARPAGSKFAHRATDRPAGSSPSMKWVNPPVAYMLHAGAPLLIGAGVHLPGLHAGDERRVALEAYPGLLARELIGRRSYKSDEVAKQTVERARARQAIVAALLRGHTRLGIRLAARPMQRALLVDDASGDTLDAVLAAVQAAWASRQPGYGLPAAIDPVEGWIVGA